MPTQEELLAEFYERRRRKERHSRVGAGFSDGAKKIENAGTGITAPVTAAELLDRVTMVCEVEFFGQAPVTFLTSAGGINAGTEVVTTLAAHGLTTADPVTYNAGGAEDVGLTDGAKYFVNVIAASTFSLHVSASDASGDLNRVDLSVSGAETHSFVPVIRDYPQGTLFSTGTFTVLMTAAGIYAAFGPGVSIAPSMTANTPANGLHTVVAYFEVRTVGTGVAVIFLDGVEVGRSDTGTFTAWGTAGATWAYMNGVTGIGLVTDLEVFPGFKPASVVG